MSKSSLHKILIELELQEFAAAFEKEGFADSQDLIDLGEDEARKLAIDVGMGRGHIVRLIRWIRNQINNEAQKLNNLQIINPNGVTEDVPETLNLPTSQIDIHHEARDNKITTSSVENNNVDEHGAEEDENGEMNEVSMTESEDINLCSVNHNEARPATLWCAGGCGWICNECAKVHQQHSGLFLGHNLLPFPPPKPFWEELNVDSDNDRNEIFTVDFSDPRLVKRDQRNWQERFSNASPDIHVPVVSFVGPTGSGKSFLLTSLMAPDQRRGHGPTVSAACQHEPESGNVFVFDSEEIGEFSKMLLVDFEGEDGAVPRSLMRRITRLADPVKMAESLANASASAANVPKNLSKFLEKASQQALQQARAQAAAFSNRSKKKKTFTDDKPYKSHPLIHGPVPIKRGGSHVMSTPRLSKFQELENDLHLEIKNREFLQNHYQSDDSFDNEENETGISLSKLGVASNEVVNTSEPNSGDSLKSAGSWMGGGGNRSRGVSEEDLRHNHRGLMGALEQLGDEWQYEMWSINRRDTVNRVLPVLAYLLSDVIVFVDTVEPRRLQAFFERVQEFASTAWAGCKASGWQPALIMIQNKWNPTGGDNDVDITEQFFHNVDKNKGLEKVFNSVHFLRMPHSEVNSGGVLGEAVNILRRTIGEASLAVKQKRISQGTLFMEKEWWRLAPKVAEEYSRTREPVSLPRIQLRSSAPAADDEGVDQLFAVIDQSTQVFSEDSDGHFNEVKRTTVEMFRYSVAVRMRRNVRTFHDAEVYGRECFSLVDKVTDRYRCCSAETTTANGTFRCTQLRRGHGLEHRNPTLIDVSGRVASWFGWKTQIPLQWSGEFEEPPSTDVEGSRENEWLQKLEELLQLSDEEFFWRYISAVEDIGLFRNKSTFHHFACLRCLQPIKPSESKKMVSKPNAVNLQNKNHTKSSSTTIKETTTNDKHPNSPNVDAAVTSVPLATTTTPPSSSSSAASASVPTSGSVPSKSHPCRQLRMLSSCGHFVCEDCINDGKNIALNTDVKGDVLCGVCGETSSWISSQSLLPPDCGPRILSLDGGGIRGLVEITVLKHLCQLTGGLQPHELFDVIGGTSTGGILAVSFGALRKSPEVVHDMYVKLTGSIFKRTGISRVLPDTVLIAIGHTILNNQILESDLKTNYGEEKIFGDFPLLPKFFVTAFDIVTEKTAVFGNFSQSDEDTDMLSDSDSSDNPVPKFGSIEFRQSSHVSLWKAALASSAVPFYFPAINIDDDMYADGGMDANCPVEPALASAEYQFPDRSVEILLSLGAGTASNEKMKKEEAKAEAQGRGIGWITALLSLQMESDRKWTECVARLTKEVKLSMIRLNPPEVGNIDPFDASKCEETVNMTERKLREPVLSALLLSAASRLKAKAYFLQSPFQPDKTLEQKKLIEGASILNQENESKISKRYIRVAPGKNVVFLIRERITRPGALPSARVRRFNVQAELLRVSHVSSDISAEEKNDLPNTTPTFDSHLNSNDKPETSNVEDISDIASCEEPSNEIFEMESTNEFSNVCNSLAVAKKEEKEGDIEGDRDRTRDEKDADDEDHQDEVKQKLVDEGSDRNHNQFERSEMLSLSSSCPSSDRNFVPLSADRRALSFSPISSSSSSSSSTISKTISNDWFDVDQEVNTGTIEFRFKFKKTNKAANENMQNHGSKNDTVGGDHHRCLVVVALVVNLVESVVGGATSINPISGCPCVVYFEIDSTHPALLSRGD